MDSQSSLRPPRWLIWTLAGVVALLAAYSVWWWIAAGILDDTLAAFRRDTERQGGKAGWAAQRITGYPFRLRATLTKPDYRSPDGMIAWSAETLAIELLPWTVRHIVFSAGGAQSLTLRGGSAVFTTTGRAATAQASLAFDAKGVLTQFDAAVTDADAQAETGAEPVTVKAALMALHWRLSPEDTDAKDGQDYDAAANGRDILLSGVTLPLGPEIADVALQLTLREVPALGGMAGAMDLTAWRAKGAPMAVRKLSFVSGGADISGGGALSLSGDAVLRGDIALTVGGMDKILGAMRAQGAIDSETQAALTLTTGMLGVVGVKVPLPLSFGDSGVFLGPARIAPPVRLVN